MSIKAVYYRMKSNALIFLLVLISIVLSISSTAQVACRPSFCSQLLFYRLAYVIVSSLLLVYSTVKIKHGGSRLLLLFLISLNAIAFLSFLQKWNPHIAL
jgi:hypothetical protein